MKVFNATKGMPEQCEYCKVSGEDLRPYGKNGAWICYKCGTSDEHIKETQKNLHNILGNNDVFITDP